MRQIDVIPENSYNAFSVHSYLKGTYSTVNIWKQYSTNKIRRYSIC